MFKKNDKINVTNGNLSYNGIVVNEYPLVVLPLNDYAPFVKINYDYQYIKLIDKYKNFKINHNCILNIRSLYKIINVKPFINELNIFLSKFDPYYKYVKYENEFNIVITNINGYKCYDVICIETNQKLVIPEFLIIKYGIFIEDEYSFKHRTSIYTKNDIIKFSLNDLFDSVGIIKDIEYFNEFNNEYYYSIITTSSPYICISINELSILQKITKNTKYIKKSCHKFTENENISIKINDNFIVSYLNETCNNFGKGKIDFINELNSYRINYNDIIRLNLKHHSDYDKFYYDINFCNGLLLPEKTLIIFK